MQLRLIQCLVFLVFSLTACVERTLDLPEEYSQPRLAVIATLADSVRMEVLISNAVSFDTDTFRHAVTNAEVTLYKNGTFAASLYYTPMDNCDGGCGFRFSRYLTDRPVEVEYGANYHLEVSAPGYPDLSSEPVYAQRQLSGVKLAAVFSDTTFYFNDPNYPELNVVRVDTLALQYDFLGDRQDELKLEFYRSYRIDTSPISFWFPDPNDQVELSVENSNPQVFTYPTFSNISLEAEGPGSYFTIDLVRYPAAFVAFRDEISKQRNTNNIAGIYAASPTPIPTNMIGGYGYFTILEHYMIYHDFE